MPDTRPSRAEVFMQMAELIAQRSTCLRGHVGAVIVKDGRVVSMGYNGAPPHQPHCLDVGCEPVDYALGDAVMTEAERLKRWGCQRIIHAEQNALVFAARMGVATEHGAVYCTHAPCSACARSLTASGIVSLYYRKEYRASRLDLLTDAGIGVHQL